MKPLEVINLHYAAPLRGAGAQIGIQTENNQPKRAAAAEG